VNALIFSQFIPEAVDLGFEYAESNPELENNGKVRSMWKISMPSITKQEGRTSRVFDGNTIEDI